MSGRTSRNKGARFERKLAHRLQIMGFKAKRCLQFRGDSDGPDVLIELSGSRRLLIEAKHHKKVRWRGAYEQAAGYPMLKGDLFAVCCKDDRNEEVWILPAAMMDLFFEMLRDNEKCSSDSE